MVTRLFAITLAVLITGMFILEFSDNHTISLKTFVESPDSTETK